MVSIFLYTWPVWYLFTSKKNHASIESKWERIFLKHTKNDWSFPSFTKCYGGDNQKIKAENEEQECFWSSSFRGLVLLCNSLYKPVLQARQREGSTLENNGWSKSNYSWDFLKHFSSPLWKSCLLCKIENLICINASLSGSQSFASIQISIKVTQTLVKCFKQKFC